VAETELALAAAGGFAVTLVAGTAIVCGFRRAMRRRFDRLEEALRVYNNASASVGRQVTVMEQELQELRRRLAEAEAARSPASAEARGGEPGGRADQRFSSAEARLAELIRSRLETARPA
jgi:phage shock protein A